jgi:hypothetical protein
MLTMVVLGFGAGILAAADPMSDIEAKPTRWEPLTKDTLMNMQGE